MREDASINEERKNKLNNNKKKNVVIGAYDVLDKNLYCNFRNTCFSMIGSL